MRLTIVSLLMFTLFLGHAQKRYVQVSFTMPGSLIGERSVTTSLIDSIWYVDNNRIFPFRLTTSLEIDNALSVDVQYLLTTFPNGYSRENIANKYTGYDYTIILPVNNKDRDPLLFGLMSGLSVFKKVRRLELRGSLPIGFYLAPKRDTVGVYYKDPTSNKSGLDIYMLKFNPFFSVYPSLHLATFFNLRDSRLGLYVSSTYNFMRVKHHYGIRKYEWTISNLTNEVNNSTVNHIKYFSIEYGIYWEFLTNKKRHRKYLITT